jgi:predicted nuclease of predicted toxin-antitoxin system
LEAAVRLYLDENLSPRIAIQLRQRGVDAVSVRDLDVLGDDGVSHLERATRMGRALVTTDLGC